MAFPDAVSIEDGADEPSEGQPMEPASAREEDGDISGTPGEAHRERKARHEIDRTAATEPVEDSAKGPARPMAKERDDSAGKRGRQMNARLVRMHGGLVIEGGR